jgi:ankyrin repeat protein
MMEFLTQRGLKVTAVDSTGQTLLTIAASKGHKAAAEWLLRHGVAVDAADADGCTALHAACVTDSGDDAAMIELLLANGADVNHYARGQRSALEGVAISGNVQCARVLIAAGIDINLVNDMNMTCLHLAIMAHHSAVVQLLLEHGATAVMNSVIPIRCLNKCCAGETALMMCTDVNTVKLLLAAGADVHITNSAGDTALHVAAKHNWTAPMLCYTYQSWC